MIKLHKPYSEAINCFKSIDYYGVIGSILLFESAWHYSGDIQIECYRNICVDASKVAPAISGVSFFLGLLFLCSSFRRLSPFKERICPQCQSVYFTRELDVLCPQCNITLEPLNGFYERHRDIEFTLTREIPLTKMQSTTNHYSFIRRLVLQKRTLIPSFCFTLIWSIYLYDFFSNKLIFIFHVLLSTISWILIIVFIRTLYKYGGKTNHRSWKACYVLARLLLIATTLLFFNWAIMGNVSMR